MLRTVLAPPLGARAVSRSTMESSGHFSVSQAPALDEEHAPLMASRGLNLGPRLAVRDPRQPTYGAAPGSHAHVPRGIVIVTSPPAARSRSSLSRLREILSPTSPVESPALPLPPFLRVHAPKVQPLRKTAPLSPASM